MSKHTPGPWGTPYFEQEEGYGNWWIHNGKIGFEEYAVACTFSLNPKAEAGARLIAMSPEMFEVLQAIAGEGMSMYGSPTDMLEKFQDMARTVVAKVTGDAK